MYGVESMFTEVEMKSQIDELIEALKKASDIIYNEFGSDHGNTIWINNVLAKFGVKEWWVK